jgi:HlyD family secretion protein
LNRRRLARGLILALGVLGAVAAGYGLWRRGQTRGLVFSGEVQARTVEVGSLVGGRVERVHVDEGAAVVEGAPLVTLDPSLIDAQIGEQEGRVAAAQAAVERAVAGPRAEETRRARIDWQNAEQTAERQRFLERQGAATRQQVDDAVARAATAREVYLQSQRGTRPEDLASARAALAQESSRLAYLRRQREEMIVRAPAHGRIESIDLRPGDLVGPNAPVASILEPSELWVRVYVPEPALGRVHLQQPADVQIDTFPGRVFPGRVVEIAFQAEYTPRNIQTREQRQDRVFGVKVALEAPGPLRPGMAATVRLREPRPGDAGPPPQARAGEEPR